MTRLIQAELEKIFLRGRTYIGFAAVAVIVLVIQGAVYVDGQKLLDFATGMLEDIFYFEGNLLNGYLTTYVILNSLFLHIPFLVALVTGDLIAGESAAGTFRQILCGPVSRFKLITAKFLAGIVYTLLLMGFMALLSLGLGVLLFGTGDIVVLKKAIHFIPVAEALPRLIWAFAFGMLGMTVVAALSFYLSSLAENSIGPIIGTMAVVIFCTVISSLNMSIFKYIRPFLFTTYLTDWRAFFDLVPDYTRIIWSSLILFGHVVLFFGLTAYRFSKRDILS
jgi:ABC-2 type transport system permease protein